MVIEPKQGIYHNAVVEDAASLYPTMVIYYFDELLDDIAQLHELTLLLQLYANAMFTVGFEIRSTPAIVIINGIVQIRGKTYIILDFV